MFFVKNKSHGIKLVIAFFSLGFFMGSTSSVHAIIENDAYVPKRVKDSMVRMNQIDASGKTLKNNAKCGNYNNAQWRWVSFDQDDKVSSPLDTSVISINDSVNSVNLRLNGVSIYCNSIINTNTGQITDKKLARTAVTVSGAITGTVKDARGNAVSGTNITAGFSSSNRSVIQNYSEAAAGNWRYVKKTGVGQNGIMENLPFTLSGLNTLPASDDIYTISLRVPVRMVNDFPDGYGIAIPNSGGARRFVCIDSRNPPYATENIFGTNNASCLIEEITLTIKLRIRPEYAGSCDIQNVFGVDLANNNRVEMQVGQKFGARFKVTNEGTRDWSMFFVKLGSFQPLDNKTWGPQRVLIKEERILGGTFPVIQSGRSSTWDTAGDVFTAPSLPGEYLFSWRLLQEGGTDSGYKNITNMGDCETLIKVKTKQNLPFIGVYGDDVYSGAGFANNESGACIVSPRARQANIATNGYYGAEPLRRLIGFSHAQYAVFASGNIGNSLVGSNNSFLGNIGYYRPSLGEYTNDIRDALFAGINTASENYGHFYDDSPNPAVPCVDISADETKAAASATLTNAAEVRTFLESSISGVRNVVGPISLPALTVGTGKKTIVVSDTVTLQGSIRYVAPYSGTNIPYLKIISKGNIYIEADATVIDAHLVAFPVGADFSQKGIVDTCSNMDWQNIGAPSKRPGEWPTEAKMTTGSCKRQPSLTVNGTVTARSILWKRTNGTIGGLSDAADSSCYFARFEDPSFNTPDAAVARYKLCAAELINGSPESYLSGFSDQSQNFSFVPVNTQELPPVY